ncbi:DNA primase catalytic core domain-containing protein, partial [Natrinema gari JCM 14663]
ATYDGSPSDLNRLKEYVAQQDAPVRRGTEHIGLHEDEWVVPDGTLTADGWTDDPGSVFEAANTPLANKCSLEPDMGDDYDDETVREILRLLPKTRITERLLPALGWFYAAATRPYIQQWEGEFNILAVTGDTGAGKPATLETLWSCFGVGGDLLRADGTTFPKMRALATSNALPIVFDEYKPADMSSYAVDQFHSLLRTSTRGGIEEKGRPDGSVVGHELLAPAVISGEQALRGTAEERRTLQTNFSRQASVGGTPESEAFARLTGGEVNGEVAEGYDLSEHALAYYQWVLDQGEDDLRSTWRDAREEATDCISELGFSGLDDMRHQAIQTLIYGCRLYQSFAHDMGLGAGEVPI